MGDFFCCIPECRSFTMQSALFIHRGCAKRKDLILDKSDWSDDDPPWCFSKDQNARCTICNGIVADEKGHYRICPDCFNRQLKKQIVVKRL